jgi:cytochrome c oxidase assembly protein subunit 15
MWSRLAGKRLLAARPCWPGEPSQLKLNFVRRLTNGPASGAEVEVTGWVKPGWEQPVGTWLMGTAGALVGMVLLGGYTRLSGSGLSMTSWRPKEWRLPSSEEAWEKEFDIYKAFPEYERTYAGGMELSEFKRIYFVEWSHRMVGRGLGFGFVVPLMYFAGRGALRRPLIYRLTGLLGLGLFQGGVGWWMVRSGLEKPEQHFEHSNNKTVRVSPYRIAFHWTMALALYGGTLWCALSVLSPAPAAVHLLKSELASAHALRRFAKPVAAVATTTLLSGPFVAGNEAGLQFNTWPKMNDDWVPPEVTAAWGNLPNTWRQIFEDTATVQFDHRCLAYSTVLGSAALAISAANSGAAAPVRGAALLLAACTAGQMCLGITTLLLYVPISAGVAHQGGGVVVWSALLNVLHKLRVPATVAASVAVASPAAVASRAVPAGLALACKM